jgi:hypothetical protein
MRVGKLVGAALLTAGIIVSPVSSASAAPQRNCDSSWQAWDSEEGNGTGRSWCWTPYMTSEHRVLLFCHYGGHAYGTWARPWQDSWTTCVDGSGAYGSRLEIR